MTDRHISLKAFVELIVDFGDETDATYTYISRAGLIEALSALPAVGGCDSLQQCMNELNATKDALADAVAEIALLESRNDRDWNDRRD